MKRYPKYPSKSTRLPELPHGTITGYYVVIYDRHIRREIIIPASKLDILKGTIKLP